MGTKDIGDSSNGVVDPGAIIWFRIHDGIDQIITFVEPRKESHRTDYEEKADENKQPNLKYKNFHETIIV